jgi:hypothetical protein
LFCAVSGLKIAFLVEQVKKANIMKKKWAVTRARKERDILG